MHCDVRNSYKTVVRKHEWREHTAQWLIMSGAQLHITSNYIYSHVYQDLFIILLHYCIVF